MKNTKHIYTVDGMTCVSCQKGVQEALLKVPEITEVSVDLESKEAKISMTKNVPLNVLQIVLPEKYKIKEKLESNIKSIDDNQVTPSKLVQLKPLFIILFYLAVASILIHRNNLVLSEMMTDFMGLFFIVFSFFKMLDLKGFPTTFAMYDPIAKVIPFYAVIYPFIETALGLMLLFRFKVEIALLITIFILGFTTIGVTKTLMSKRKIKCACLGTALNLPMTEATFIENILMISMAAGMFLLK